MTQRNRIALRLSQAARARRATRPKRNLIRAEAVEALETRALLSITSTTLAPMAPVEGQLFKSLVNPTNPGFNDTNLIATFIDDNPTANPAGFTGFLSWGDGGFDQQVPVGGLQFVPDSVVHPGKSTPNQWDVFSGPSSLNPQGGHTYLEETITPLTVYFLVSDTSTTNPGTGFAFNPNVIVTDAPLTGAGVGTISPVEGQPFTGPVATFTDADPNTNATEYAAVITWGDGSTSAGSISAGPTVGTPLGPRTQFIVTGTHSYSEEGTYPSFDSKGNPINPPLSVLITDTDGHTPPQGTRATTTVTDVANVADAPLSAAVPQTPFSALEGNNSAGVVASFLDTDTGANLVKETYTGTINWGDGTSTTFSSSTPGVVQLVSSSSAGVLFNVFGTHTYAEEGTPTIKVTINDDGGQSTTVTNSAKVGDAPISVQGAQISAVEGKTASLTVGTIIDNNPGAPASDFSGTVYWGDGTSSTFGPGNVSLVSRTPTQSIWTVTASHQFKEDGIFTNTNDLSKLPPSIGIVVNDVGGQSGTAVSTATVLDAPLHGATLSIPAQVENNGFVNLPVATFEDEDPFGIPNDYTVTIVWGDGSAPTAGTVVANGIDPANGFAKFTVLGTHAPYSDGKNYGYGEEGTYQVTVQVTDTDQHLPVTPAVPRSSTSVSSTVTVNDAPLTPNPFTPPQPNAGIPLPSNTTAGAFHDTDPGNPGDPTTDPSDYSATIDWGDGHTSAGTIVYAGTYGDFLVQGSNTYNKLGPFTVTVTIKDHGAPLVETYQVNSTLVPVIVTGVNVNTVEGVALTNQLVATFVNPFVGYNGGYTASINWGDGTVSPGTVTNNTLLGRFDVTGNHTYMEAGVFTITTSVTETAVGGATSTGTSKATVQDAPLIPSPVNFKGTELTPLSSVIVGQFTDQDPFGVPSDYAVTINWNDGSAIDTTTGKVVLDHFNGSGQPVFNVLGSHTYAEEGIYAPVTIHVAEIDLPTPPPVTPASTDIFSTAAIADAPLFAAANPYPISTTEGQPFPNTFDPASKTFPGFGVVVATFTDGAPEWPDTSDYGALIQWNGPVNGSPASPGKVVADPNIKGLFDVLGNATYTEAGLYHPTVLVTDIGGSNVTVTATATVLDAPIFASGTGTTTNPLISTEGAIFTGTVASFYDTDPFGVAGDYAVTINWGDGTTSPGTVVPSIPHSFSPFQPGFTVQGTHTYAEQGNFTIGVGIVENDLPAPPPGGFAATATTSAISVFDAPLTAAPAQLQSAVEGSSYAAPVTVATFTDADPGGVVTDYKATIDWGDGTGTLPGTVVQVTDSKGNPLPGQFAVQGNHTFAEDGFNTVKVVIYDTDGGPINPTPSPFQATTTVSDFVTVFDAPLKAGPAVTIPTQLEAMPFTSITVGSFYDTDPGGQVGDYTVSINWGDGSAPSAGTVVANGTLPGTNFPLFLVKGSHTYGEEMPRITTTPPSSGYVVTVQITDTDQHLPATPGVPRAGINVQSTINVADAPLSLISASPSSVHANGLAAQTVALAQFSDPDTAEVPSDYSAVIKWSDGTTSPGFFIRATDSKGNIIPGQFLLEDSHLFSKVGPLTAQWTIYDTDGVRAITDPISATLPGATLINVTDAALTSIGTPQTVQAIEGQDSGAIVVGTFQYGNPGAPASNFTATINWGDGTTSAGTVQPSFPAGNFNVLGSHAYLEEGSYNVTVLMVSAGGSTATANNTTVNVGDAPLSPVNNPLTIQAHTNVPFSNQIVGTFMDADRFGGSGVGPQPDYVATIFWGDGTSSAATGFVVQSTSSAGAVVNVLGGHTYSAVGTYFIFCQVTDVDGGSPTAPGRQTTFTFNVQAQVVNFAGAASVATNGTTGFGIASTGASSTQSSSSSRHATVDAALTSVASDNIVVPSGIIGLTNVATDGSTGLGVKKKSLVTVG